MARVATWVAWFGSFVIPFWESSSPLCTILRLLFKSVQVYTHKWVTHDTRTIGAGTYITKLTRFTYSCLIFTWAFMLRLLLFCSMLIWRLHSKVEGQWKASYCKQPRRALLNVHHTVSFTHSFLFLSILPFCRSPNSPKGPLSRLSITIDPNYIHYLPR